MSWSTRSFGPTKPAQETQPSCPVSTNDTSAALRSMIAGSALKGPLVSAPSDPAPVVDGDLPVIELMNSMKSSGSSM